MTLTRWLDHGGDAVHTRVAEASEALAAALHDANHAFVQRGRAGMEAARAVGDQALGGARRIGHSTHGLIAERPVETALVVGAACFALGWLARWVREAPAPADARQHAAASASAAKLRPRAAAARRRPSA